MADLDKPMIVKGEALLPLDKYIDFQENLNYGLMLHSLRLALLIKLVNKSSYLKTYERLQK